MKKFYSLFALLFVATVAMTANAARTITVNIDDASHASLYNQEVYQTVAWEGNSATITFSQTYSSFNISCEEGWELASVTVDGAPQEGAAGQTYYNMNYEVLKDKAVVNITTQEHELKYVYVHADASMVSVQDFNYSTLSASQQEDGAWKIAVSDNPWSNLYISVGEDAVLKSVKDEDGKEYASPGATYANIYASSFTAATTHIYVDAVSKNDFYDGSVTVNVHDGQPYMVNLYTAAGGQEYLNATENTVRFDSASALPFNFSHSYNSSYNPTFLYKVTLNGTAITANADGSFTVTPAVTGDVIDVYIEAPQVMVPVYISGSAFGAVERVSNSNGYLDRDQFASFTTKLGSNVTLALNTAGWDISGVTCNGTPYYINEWNEINIPASSETGNYINVEGTAKAGYEVTVVCENWQGLSLSKDYSGNSQYTVTGEETVLDVAASDTELYVRAQPGWILKSITNALTGSTYATYNPVTVSNGLIIVVEVEEIKRDNTAHVYVDKNVSWDFLTIRLSPQNYDTMMALNIGENFQPGYFDLKFADFDCPFQISGYANSYSITMPHVFLNDTELPNEYGAFAGLENIQDGDLLKIMGTDERYTLTYTVKDANVVNVLHDGLTKADHTAVHNVLNGTEVHIVPTSKLTHVTVNTLPVSADETGKYVFTVNDHSTVDVGGPLSGVDNITVDGAAATGDVYNTQGVLMIRNANADQLKNLPRGIYIVNGTKIVK